MRATTLALFLGLSAMPAAAEAAGGLMDYDTDFCARRAYGEAHLKAHPTQTVSGLSIFALKGWNRAAGRDLPYLDPTVGLSVTAGGRPWATQPLFCTDYDEDVPEAQRAPRAYYCAPVCGGRLRITVDGDTLTATAFDMPRRCALPALDGAGDRIFVLKRAPMAECAVPKEWPRDEAGMEAFRLKKREAFAVE